MLPIFELISLPSCNVTRHHKINTQRCPIDNLVDCPMHYSETLPNTHTRARTHNHAERKQSTVGNLLTVIENKTGKIY